MYNFPKKVKHARLSISIPAELVQWARETAVSNKTTLSAVVEYAIRNMKAEPLRKEMVKGLLEDADDPVIDTENQAWMNAPMGRR